MAGKVPRRFRVPGFCRSVAWLDTTMHTRLGWLPLPFHAFVCDLYDWSLGLTWREARS
jgi:hypothetical protein